MNTLIVAPPFALKTFELDHDLRKPSAPPAETPEEGRVFYVVTGILGVAMFVLCGIAVASMALAINFSQ